MTIPYTPIRCNDCDQVLNDKAQYYDDKKVYCEVCNYRKGGEEWPKPKKSVVQ